MSLKVVNHPVALHALTILRDKDSRLREFREACDQVVPVVLYAATKHFELRDKQIVTPICEMVGSEMANEVVLIPILRAGMAMVEPALKLLPFARVGYIGMQRDEKTAVASTYYKKLPSLTQAHVLLLDPMLATGGSADYAIQEIKKHNPKTLTFCCLVAAPEGIALLKEKYPDLKIFCTALDERLNDKKCIVPGLGDFGDRYHGTDW
jgi:uracil phosphoribosyltransferase